MNTDRGYTNHEHLDEFGLGLIHMNGRIYDPATGRFLSADPYIQQADNLQSYNRYSYVLNNPLYYTDPSGYFSLRRFIRTAAIAIAAYYTGGAISSAYAASAATSAASIATSTIAITGSVASTATYSLVYSAAYSESPRELRRLHYLREWSHDEQIKQIFP